MYGPVRTVVWQGSAGNRRPYADPLIEIAVARSGTNKVDIIAHSMGGAVARSYIQDPRRDLDSKVRKLAIVGTPNAGALASYFLWQGGDVKQADAGALSLLTPVEFYEDTIDFLYRQEEGGTSIYNYGFLVDRERVKDFVQDELKGIPSLKRGIPTFPFLLEPGEKEADAHSLPTARANHWLEALNTATWTGTGSDDLNLRSVAVRLFSGISQKTDNLIITRTDAIYGVDGGPLVVIPSLFGDGTVVRRSLLATQLDGSPSIPADLPDYESNGKYAQNVSHRKLIRAHLYGDNGLVKFITGTAAVAPAATGNTNLMKGNSPVNAANTGTAITRVASGLGAAMTGPAMLELSVAGPAVALVEQVDAPGLTTGVMPSLLPVINLPESDLSVAGGETHIAVRHPYLPDGSGGPLRVRLTMTGSGDYAVSIALLADDEVKTQEFLFHTNHADRVLLLNWNQVTESFSVIVGATPPTPVTTAPSSGATVVSWSPVPGATGYHIFRRRDALPNFELVATVAANALSWLAVDDPWSDVAGVPPTQFAVSTLMGLDESAFSIVVSNTDQDGDGLPDVEETAKGTNPALADTDGDGLSDWSEVQIGTNPLMLDTDGDGQSDGIEYRVGSDPQSASVTTGPKPNISAISPPTAVAGQDVVLTVTGSGFFDSVSVIKVAGVAASTTFVSGSQLTASVPAALLCPIGLCAITVDNPSPGGGLSNGRSLQVITPGSTSISPNSEAQGMIVPATIAGTNLTGATAVTFSGAGVTAIIGGGGTDTNLPVTIAIAVDAPVGPRTVTVTVPGGTSNSLCCFTVTSPPGASPPVINSLSATPSGLSQTAAPLFGGSFTLTVNGQNFDAASTIKLGATPMATAFIGATQLQGSVTTAALAAPGNPQVTVTKLVGQSELISNAVTLRIIERGDTNGNRSVNIGDALVCALTVGGINRPPLPVSVGDLNLNGSVNIGDCLVGALFAGRVNANYAVPTITSVSPATAVPSSLLTITGIGLAPGTTTAFTLVSFTTTGDAVARVIPTAASPTSVTVMAPSDAVSGAMQVYRTDTPLGGAEFPLPVGSGSALVLTNASPFFGVTAGNSLTLTGMGFSATAASNGVTFTGSGGTVNGTVTAAATTSLTVTVPSGAVCGPVRVTVAGQTSNARMVTVSGTPCGVQLADIWGGGTPGDTIVLEGAGFDVATPANNIVRFAAVGGGTVTAPVLAAGGTQLHVRIPATAIEGNVTVTVGATTSSGLLYRLTPSTDALVQGRDDR